jgi:heme/copper-type cytochrome/quinol oxidase subunit 4
VAILAVGLHFIPVLIVIGKKLWRALPYRLFALYWLTAALINLLTFMPLSNDAMELCTVIFKLLDIPLILAALYFSTTSRAVRKFTKFMAPTAPAP